MRDNREARDHRNLDRNITRGLRVYCVKPLENKAIRFHIFKTKNETMEKIALKLPLTGLGSNPHPEVKNAKGPIF